MFNLRILAVRSATLAVLLTVVGHAASAQAAPVTIRFKAKVGGLDFACGQTYSNIGAANTAVRPLDFRFFVQDLKLIRSDSVEVPVQLDTRSPWQSNNVALLDFENGTADCAGEGNAEMNTTITGTVPDGTYTGVSFVNGIPDAWNHANASTLPAPFSSYATLQWAWLSGFRFVKAELLPLPAGANRAFAHLGSTSCTGNPSAGTVTCAHPNRNKIVLSGFDRNKNIIQADIAAIFAGNSLTSDQQCHSTPADICTPMFSALGVNFSSGAPLSSQSTFRAVAAAVPLPLQTTWLSALGLLAVASLPLRRRERG